MHPGCNIKRAMKYNIRMEFTMKCQNLIILHLFWFFNWFDPALRNSEYMILSISSSLLSTCASGMVVILYKDEGKSLVGNLEYLGKKYRTLNTELLVLHPSTKHFFCTSVLLETQKGPDWKKSCLSSMDTWITVSDVHNIIFWIRVQYRYFFLIAFVCRSLL